MRSAPPARWGSVHKLVHWTIALLVVAQAGIGFFRMPVEDDALSDTLMAWHINIGFTILWLMVLRLGWRLSHPVRRLPDTLSDFEKVLARANHYGFYVLLLAQPVVGWLNANSGGYSARIYGLAELPQLIAKNDEWRDQLDQIHFWLAIVIILSIIAHVPAALRHHFLLRDDTLRGMLPGGPSTKPQA